MADKPKKPQKLKARLPRGLEDRGPAAIAATRQMVEKIREVYERYGFEPVETPAMEFTDALGKFLPDQDRPNEGVFSFQDDDEQWISLRYDLTAPLARYVAENFDQLPKPYRSYRAGYVYRNEKPGPGRFRQFMQFDADTVGSPTMAADAEICMMAADTMEALGIPRGSYVVKVNNRKVLDGVRERIGIADDGQWLTVMRAIDKLDRLGIAGVQQLLGDGRKDESGDFTKGAGLADDIALVVGAVEPGAPTDARLRDSRIGQEGREELDATANSWWHPVTAPIGSRSIPPSSAGSNTTRAPSTKSNSRSKPATKKAAPFASAPSAAAGAMTVSSRASAASRCRRLVSPSACRGCRPR